MAIGAGMTSVRGSFGARGSLGTASTFRSVSGPALANLNASIRKSWTTFGTLAISSTATTTVA